MFKILQLPRFLLLSHQEVIRIVIIISEQLQLLHLIPKKNKLLYIWFFEFMFFSQMFISKNKRFCSLVNQKFHTGGSAVAL